MRILVILCSSSMLVQSQSKHMTQHKHTNQLINETSPYLLQHAHNPVDWKPWSDDALKQAKKEQKLIIISVGYSACHWCHVMEHESFEDEDVASLMNAHFINIKVDREERPDVDQVYMNAVQLMTGRGGWPLNVVALPDGRPVWGGTYFPKRQWMQALAQIQKLYAEQPEKLEEYATKLTDGIKAMELLPQNQEPALFKSSDFKESIASWSQQFDHKRGGLNYAPKFMMPNNYHFLLRYAYQKNDKALQDFVNLTLQQMAMGGIYDQIGGGFSRYSVDANWHVPHFEKMLYDNGQLVSLLADAYLITKDPLYEEAIVETLSFIKAELTGNAGNFYSALDADSQTENGDLEEGAFYVWQKDQLKTLLADDFNLFADYYNINNYGYWEHGNYVLIRTQSDSEFIEKHKLDLKEFQNKKQAWKQMLEKERSKRPKPRLDSKSLTSWNAIMLKGYVDAYRVLNDEAYLKTALDNADFIVDKQLKQDGGLYRNFNQGKSNINGYLEDYAHVIQAFLDLYEVTFDPKWLNSSKNLANYAIDHFLNDETGMFYFTSDEDELLVARTSELRDNVIPASNSVMAKNLFRLGHHFLNERYKSMSERMLHQVQNEIKDHPTGHSNWMDLMLNHTELFYEVVVVGESLLEKTGKIREHYLPNILVAGSTKDLELPLLKNRYQKEGTFIYVCENNSCRYPTSNIQEALDMLNEP